MRLPFPSAVRLRSLCRTAGCSAWLLALALVLPLPAHAETPFINYESPHVHPIDLSPNGELLAVCNTPAGAIELLDVRQATPELLVSIPVGLEPVTVRFRSDTELWVANQLSDSVSIVSVSQRCVTHTLQTLDEPADVVFAGDPPRAFVSCSQEDTLLVFDPAQLKEPPRRIKIKGQRPRGMAVSPDGKKVYVAIFESGNGTTLLGGGGEEAFGKPFPPNVVNDRRGPYGEEARVNPPPNDGKQFTPELTPENPPPPRSGLIVRKNREGRWLDDNGKDWTRFVHGDLAPLSGRVEGWDLVDHDLAMVDTCTGGVTYAGGMMNLCMSLAVNPATGQITVTGTDAHNEVRFEPVLNGVFHRVLLGLVDGVSNQVNQVLDLNPHLDYRTRTVPVSIRERSLGDPRALAWTADGTRGFVAGMGSDNIIVIDKGGKRLSDAPIKVGAGPTGLAIDGRKQRLYVLNRFEASISVVDLESEQEIGRVRWHDPTPEIVRRGRKQFYNTHRGSGLGHLACASCHVDGRMDRLAWDLGNPAGEMTSPHGGNLGAGIGGLDSGFTAHHPMKGPMLTQTLQDIIGKEPFHWRGDRKSIEEFNETFRTLQGADRQLTDVEMEEFKAFLSSLYFPPNPYRTLDNSLPERIALPGHYTTGRFSPAGRPLPPGDPRQGLAIFQDTHRRIDRQAFSCVTCHTLPTGLGTDARLVKTANPRNSPGFQALPPGSAGERHHALVGINFSVQRGFKVPQLRNLYKRTGCEMTQSESLAGFGFMHDGGVDSLARFVGLEVFDVRSDAEVAHLVAFLLAFSGSEFPPAGNAMIQDAARPPGSSSQDSHAAVGRQVTWGPGGHAVEQVQQFLALAAAGSVDLKAQSVRNAAPCRWKYQPGTDDNFACESTNESLSLKELMQFAEELAPVTFTVLTKDREAQAVAAIYR